MPNDSFTSVLFCSSELLVNWCTELKIESFNLESFCSTERELLQWQSEGLPSDKISIQNTIIILKVFS